MHQELIQYCKEDWNTFLNHEFVRQLANGMLSRSSFQRYLQQDFLFLKQYARAFALGVYKSRSLEELRSTLAGLTNLVENEVVAHVNYCKTWGLLEHDLEMIPESVATVAYTRYVLDCGTAGDLADLYTALAPCALGYAEIGQRLASDPTTKLEGNPYRSWIELYAGEKSQELAKTQGKLLDQLIGEIKPNSARRKHISEIFKTATRMEIAFWQQALDTSDNEVKSGK